MKARELAEKLMENPEAEVELWDQYDYMFGTWAVIEAEEVVTHDGKTRFLTGGRDFHFY